MSTENPTCTECNSPTEFAGINRPSKTEESTFAAVWKCTKCDGQIHDPSPIGPIVPTAESCLSCGATVQGYADNKPCSCGLTAAQADAALGIETLPSDPVQAAREAFNSGMVRHSLAILNKSVQTDPSNEEAWLGKASVLEALQCEVSHTELMEHMAGLGISTAQAIHGTQLQQQGHHQKAVDIYQAFLAKTPEEELAPQVVANLAVAFQELGRPEAADTYCKTAIQSNPDQICHYTNYATMLAHQKRFSDAVATIDSGLVAVPGIPARIHLLETRSMILSDMERGQDALVTIQQAIALGADTLRAHFCLGRALALVGELGPAREEIGYVLEQDPANVFAQQAMAALDQALKKS